MKKSAVATVFFLSLVGGAGLVVAVNAQEAVADVTLSSDTVRFTPLEAEFEWLGLRITAPGEDDFLFEASVRQAKDLVFKVPGDALDGFYSWELRLIPEIPAEIRRRLRRARRSGNDRADNTLRRQGRFPEPAVIQSGSFLVQDGRIVFQRDPGEPTARDENARADETRGAAGGDGTGKEARIPTKDTVVLDDVIVDGSVCIGFDCVNGEPFGFDTLRLKENNLRIKFQDTSTATGFPSNDWQITINDTTNGGADKFSIEDVSFGKTPFTIEADARSHSVYIDDGGRLGLRTSTPSTEIHTIDGDTPTLRLEQDGSSSFAPQVWDVAGNEINFFIRDMTSGALLPFRIRPGAPTSSVDIASSGHVGVGTSSPATRLHVLEDAAEDVALFESDEALTKILIKNDSGVETVWAYSVDGAQDEFRISKQGSGQVEMRVTAGGNVEIPGNYVAGGTQLNVPDHVFEAGYSLMPLAELASFIREHKHLPKIPSARQIRAGGLDMTAMQMKLLEKIEELTLYTVELQETVEELSRRLERFEAADE